MAAHGTDLLTKTKTKIQISVQPGNELLKAILDEAKIEIQPSYTQDEIKNIVAEIFKKDKNIEENN